MKTDRELLDDAVQTLHLAWGLIANAGQGDWAREGNEWQEAALRWRDKDWHPFLDDLTSNGYFDYNEELEEPLGQCDAQC